MAKGKDIEDIKVKKGAGSENDLRNKVFERMDKLNAKKFQKSLRDNNKQMKSMMDSQIDLLKDFYEAQDELQRESVKRSIEGQQDSLRKQLNQMQKDYKVYGKHMTAQNKEYFKNMQESMSKSLEELEHDVGVRIGNIEDEIDDMADTFIDRLGLIKDTITEVTGKVRDWVTAFNINELVNGDDFDSYIENRRQLQTAFGGNIDYKEFSKSMSKTMWDTGYLNNRRETQEEISEMMDTFNTQNQEFIGAYTSQLTALKKTTGLDSGAVENIVWADVVASPIEGQMFNNITDNAQALASNENLNVSADGILSSINENIVALYGLTKGDSKKMRKMTDSLTVIEAFSASEVGADTMKGILTNFSTKTLTELRDDDQARNLVRYTGLSLEQMHSMAQSGPEGVKQLAMAVQSSFGNLSEQQAYHMVSELGIGDSVADVYNTAQLTLDSLDESIASMGNSDGAMKDSASYSAGPWEKIGNYLSDNPVKRFFEDKFGDFNIKWANLANLALIASSSIDAVGEIYDTPFGKAVFNRFLGKAGESKLLAPVLAKLTNFISKNGGSTLADTAGGVASDVAKEVAEKSAENIAGSVASAVKDSVKGKVEGTVTDVTSDFVKENFFKRVLNVFKDDADSAVKGGFFKRLLNVFVPQKTGGGVISDVVGEAVSAGGKKGIFAKLFNTAKTVGTGAGAPAVAGKSAGIFSKGLNFAKGALGKGGGLALLRASGLATMAFDGFKGAKKSEEWGTGKLSSIVGGMLAGTGAGLRDPESSGMDKVKSLAGGALKGAAIGSMLGPIGTAVGGVIGAGLAGIGGKNIAQFFSNKKKVTKGDISTSDGSVSSPEAEKVFADGIGESNKYLQEMVGLLKGKTGDGSTLVNVAKVPGGSQIDIPGFANGLSNVPRDGIVKVHEGESILTKNQSEILRGVQADGGVPIAQGGQERTYGFEILSELNRIRNLMDTYYQRVLDGLGKLTSPFKSGSSLGGGSASGGGSLGGGGIRGFFSDLGSGISNFFGGMMGGSGGGSGSVGSGSAGYLGSISSKYEVGTNGDAGFVSSGKGDAGGVSYGVPQFSSKTGSAKEFSQWLNNKVGTATTSQLAKATPGTETFSTLWKKLNTELGSDRFRDLQMGYMAQKFYEPFTKSVYSKTGIDSNKTRGLQEMAWSTATQFGSGGSYVYTTAKVNSGMNPADIISKVYQTKRDKVGDWFSGSSKSVQRGVYNRFVNEEKDLLAMANQPPLGLGSGGSANGAQNLAYEQGTPWVPNDQVALLHKGEMVVPSSVNPFNGVATSTSYNSSGSDNSQDNKEVVETLKWMVYRLETKLDKVIQASSKTGSSRTVRSQEPTDTDRVFSF